MQHLAFNKVLCDKVARHKILVAAVIAALPQLVIAEDTMPEVSVSATSVIETAHGNTEDYVANRSMTGTKTDSLIIETPQSISVVTNQQMMDQGATSLQEAVRYSVGVTAEAYGLDNRGDWLFIRGVEHTQIEDGLRSLATTFNMPRPDAYFVERLEILRGPSSVLFGQASPGGLVNIVSKRPQAESNHEVTVQYGTRNHKQISFDSTGAVSDDGRVLYRLVGAVKESDKQSDYTDNKRYQIAPSITFKPSEKTQLTLLMNLQKDKTDGATASFPPHVGTIIRSPNGKIGTDFFSGEPGFDRFYVESESAAWELSHAFNDTWTVRQNGRYTNVNVDYNSIYPAIFSGVAQTSFFLDPAQRTVARYGYSRKTEIDGWALDNQVQAKFNVGKVANTLLMGVDYMHDRAKESVGYSFIATPFDLFNPVYGNITQADLPVRAPIADVVNSQLGFYVQDQIKFGNHITVVGGLRHDKATVQTEDGASKTQTDHATTGRLGAVYQFNNGLAPYISYSESFVPIVGRNFFWQAFKPREGKQKEIGLRYQPPSSNSMYTVSVYDIEEKNRLSSDPSNPFNQLQGTEGKSWGLELDAIANLTDNIDLIANYSFTHVRTNLDTGRRVAEVHEDVASTWLTYKFSIADISGFKVGAGVRYIGGNHDETGILDIPSVTLYDAMLAYENTKWRFALNGNNITDKTYIASCLSRGDCWYGSRGSVVGSLTYKF